MPKKRLKQFMSSEEAIQAKRQHKKPCPDCPFARTAINGWLGGASPEEYRRLAHSDQVILCHTRKGVQCAGGAIYRSNVCKRVEEPALTLPKDTKLVFSTPMEFMEHHNSSLSIK